MAQRKISQALERQANKAEALINYFEGKGRRVVGVSIEKNVIHLDFGENIEVRGDTDPAGLVRMDE